VWLDDADYDLESAKTMLDSGRYFFVVFMCHLTVEKLLKAVIVERKGIVPPKIHNLVRLVELGGLTVPGEHLPLVNELDGLSVPTRYPDGRQAISSSLTQQHTTGIYERTEALDKWLRQELSLSPPSDVTPRS
jgi:HEPN domain-containing protein